MIQVPTAWAVYQVDEGGLTDIWPDGTETKEVPAVAVMEALVILGHAKRLAVIHTLNLMPSGEDENEDESLFGEGSE